MATILKFKVNALRTMASPYRKTERDDSSTETIYYMLVNMRDLPDNIPLDVNPREPKMSTSVGKSLLNAVIEPETDFYLNNRGIVIAAKGLIFNSSDSVVTVDLGNQEDDNDKFSYGILDGGHTYTAIMKKRDQIPADMEKYVRVEVITNVQNISRLSDARNTSQQVSDMALFNLDDNFSDVKSAIVGTSFEHDIAYKDNEDRPIHVSELLRLLYAFDIDRFPDDTAAPIQSYSGKALVFKRYKQAFETDFYKAVTKELPKMVELYDTVEREIPAKYKEYKKQLGVARPSFGSAKGIESIANGTKTMYLKSDTNYAISTGFIYAIFSAFRALLRYDAEEKKVTWLFDPIEIWNEVGTSVVQNTFETEPNPQLAGKNKQLWLANYRIVETQSLRKMLGRR